MAIVKPFAALRPKPELASQICELPYDVMSSDEARELAAGNPLSFLHVSKSEIDLPPGTNSCTPAVYARAGENFRKLISQGELKQDSQPCFYLYRQIMGKHSQTGLVATASCEEYLNGVIKKHELTQPDKEDDRLRHIETLNSQTGPAFLIYRASSALDGFVAKKIAGKPGVDFTGKDGVRHLSWTIDDATDIRFVQAQFEKIPFLYIADGHHRSSAAVRIFKKRKGSGHSGQFLAVIFPHNQVQILPYNRVLKNLNGRTPEQLLEILGTIFTIKKNDAPMPARKHELGFYLKGKWRTLVFRDELIATGSLIDRLDVSLLQKHVLAPVFGIDDPRTNRRINCVGGIRGAAELEKLVNSGEYACAFSMFPTSVDDLMAIADADGIMPPKSTWFEPKLRDGMFCHMI